MKLEDRLHEGRTWSFKEIDERHGCAKGAAFRAFKRISRELEEGADFHYLPAETHRGTIAELKAAGRLYRSTVNAVLLTESGYERLLTQLPTPKDGC